MPLIVNDQNSDNFGDVDFLDSISPNPPPGVAIPTAAYNLLQAYGNELGQEIFGRDLNTAEQEQFMTITVNDFQKYSANSDVGKTALNDVAHAYESSPDALPVYHEKAAVASSVAAYSVAKIVPSETDFASSNEVGANSSFAANQAGVLADIAKHAVGRSSVINSGTAIQSAYRFHEQPSHPSLGASFTHISTQTDQNHLIAAIFHTS